jgi:hypothetical protein
MADKEADDIEDLLTSKKGITINVLGVPVKLDLFNTIIGLAVGGTAIGTGYLLYNEFQNKNEKSKIEQERLRQIQYANYMRQQQEYRRQQRAAPAVATTPPAAVEDSNRIDMSYYQPPPAEGPKKLSYNEILTQAEQSNPNNPTAYSSYGPANDYNATFPTRHAPPPSQNDYIAPQIDMSRMINDQAPPPPQPEPIAPQTPMQRTEQAEQEEQQSNEEIDNLYKSMNGYN